MVSTKSSYEAGEQIELSLIVVNDSAGEKTFTYSIDIPDGLSFDLGDASSGGFSLGVGFNRALNWLRQGTVVDNTTESTEATEGTEAVIGQLARDATVEIFETVESNDVTYGKINYNGLEAWVDLAMINVDSSDDEDDEDEAVTPFHQVVEAEDAIPAIKGYEDIAVSQVPGGVARTSANTNEIIAPFTKQLGSKTTEMSKEMFVSSVMEDVRFERIIAYVKENRVGTNDISADMIRENYCKLIEEFYDTRAEETK